MFFKYNYLGLSWALVILVLCGLPGSQFQSAEINGADIVIHTFLFFVLFLLLGTGFIKQGTYPFLRTSTLMKVFVITLLYGIAIELLQGAFFVDRSFELSDVLANSFGSLLGWGGFLLIYGTESYT